jgi:hypothetical protein
MGLQISDKMFKALVEENLIKNVSEEDTHERRLDLDLGRSEKNFFQPTAFL